MEEEPDIWEKTDKYLLLSGYLIYKMTGHMVDAAASLVGQGLRDIGAWLCD